MAVRNIQLKIIFILVLFQVSEEFRFMRRIQAVGHPYYKILMALGSCKGSILYQDQKIWGKVPMNRVLDIYYKSSNRIFTVSRVEITLIINSTNTIAFSEEGVGTSEFFGTLYLPLNVGFIMYSLTIYTCVRRTTTTDSNTEDTFKPLLVFYQNMNKKVRE